MEMDIGVQKSAMKIILKDNFVDYNHNMLIKKKLLNWVILHDRRERL